MIADMDLTVAINQMDPTVATIIISTLCSTVAGLVISILAYMRESRAHKWQVEQAEVERRERITTALQLKAHAENATQTLAAKIDDNTEVSVRAFEEANNINKKIQAIGEMRLKKDEIEKTASRG